MERVASILVTVLMLAACKSATTGPMSTNLGVGDACGSSATCRAGLACTGGTCQPTGTATEGQSCMLTGDCTASLYCGPSRTCELAGAGADGDDCESTSDCAHGLLCSVEGLAFRCRAAGAGDLADTCQTERDCLAGLRCSAQPGGTRACQSPSPFGSDGGVEPELPGLPFWPGADCATDDGPPTAYFHVPRGDASDRDFYRLPFPNDVRRTATGIDLADHPAPGTTLPVDVLGRVIDAAGQDLDGFATNPVVYFRFSRDFEWGDITGDRLMLVDLSASSPEFGQRLPFGWVTTAGRITRYICPQWLAVRRGHGAPLRPATTYAVVLLRGVRTSEGQGHDDFARDGDLDALLAESTPAGDPLAAAWRSYAPLREWLSLDTSPAAADVLNATVFTTQDARALVPAIREVIRARPAPVLRDVRVCGEGVTSPCDDGEQRRCGPRDDAYFEIHARIELPQFQDGTPPYEEPADGGAIDTDAAGAPRVARIEPVCMVMTVPRLTDPPSGGFPMVFFAHGTGGAFTAPIGNGLARTFASDDGGAGAPRAITVSIDMPLHGSRRGASTRHPNNLVFNFANPRAARGNFLQGAADLMSLVRWAESFVMPAAESPTGFELTVDATRLTLFAHSQGATHAQLMLPFEPGIAAVVLSGAGGDLTESLLTKTRPVDIAGALPFALLDADGAGNLSAGDLHPALALIQMFFEPVDPVNYGALLRREPLGGRHVLMTFGMRDSYSTERTMAAYARSVGFAQVVPPLSDLGLGSAQLVPLSANVTIADVPYTIGLRQYEPAAGDDGHFVSTSLPQARADTTRFLLQALAGATPEIGM